MAEPSGPLAPRRRVALEGACNFRDLGGYRARDGRRTRWGLLFRSGSLAFLTEGDLQSLGTLGVHTICDLRRKDEAEIEPTRWPHDTSRLQWAIDEEQARLQRERGWERSPDEAAAVQMMMDAYRAMHVTLQPQVRGLFGCLRDKAVPMVFHCAAGKDRTGFLAAMVLHALGVPRDLILEDYLLTNESDLLSFVRKHQRASMGMAQGDDSFSRMDAAVRDALLAADTRYLTAAFDAIEVAHGSVDAYLADLLAFSVRDFTLLRDQLLA